MGSYQRTVVLAPPVDVTTSLDAAVLRWTPGVIGARSTGRLRGQVPGKAVEHLLAQRRCLRAVDAVQVGALLGPGQRGAVAALGELDGGDRHGDPGEEQGLISQFEHCIENMPLPPIPRSEQEEWRAHIRKGLAVGDYDDRPLVKARFGLQFTTVQRRPGRTDQGHFRGSCPPRARLGGRSGTVTVTRGQTGGPTDGLQHVALVAETSLIRKRSASQWRARAAGDPGPRQRR